MRDLVVSPAIGRVHVHEWCSITSMALARIRCCSSDFRAATEDDTLWQPHRRSASRGLYMIGGRGGDNPGDNQASIPDLTDMERFRDGAWRLLPPWPLARLNTGAAPLDGYIYVIGGQLSAQGTAVRDVEVFDPLTSKWRTGPGTARVSDGCGFRVGGGRGVADRAGWGCSRWCSRPTVGVATILPLRVLAAACCSVSNGTAVAPLRDASLVGSVRRDGVVRPLGSHATEGAGVHLVPTCR